MNASIILIFLISAAVAVSLLTRPKLLVAIALVAVLFVRTLTHLTGLQQVDVLDDALVVLCVISGLIVRIRRGRAAHYPGFGFFCAFAVAGALSGVLHPELDLTVLASGVFLATKGILFGWAVAQLDWTEYDVIRSFRTGAVVVAVILGCCIANAVAPEAWAATFSPQGGIIYRYGLPSLMGPFVHPFDLAFVASMAGIAVLAYRMHIGRGALSMILFVGTALATIGSFRRKDSLGLLVSSGVLAAVSRNAKWLTVAFVALPIVILLAWDELLEEAQALSSAYFTVDSREARTVLTLGAYTVAGDYFPFGAGFGRYGSRTAAVNYSNEYLRLGFHTVHGLGFTEGTGNFLTDTSWPAILGEAGVFGAAFFVLGLLAMARRAWRWRALDSPAARLLGTTGIGWIILTLFQSLGAAVFTAPPGFAFLFGLVGIGAAIEHGRRREPQRKERSQELA
ncbi:hypothetical protein [Desertivibrio insolitus]|uniref:hypothetical protein n=1 Tax=Herbiconiux sp. SYSU D00978 TaxID=2812562 RepID=UPI001A95FFF3|nr:hypothetical protein [Herbiconiux sp. SYSU D00978]